MNKCNFKCSRFLTATLFLLLFVKSSFATVILKNEDIVGQRAVKKIEQIGLELKQKTGVNTYVIAINSLDGKYITQYETFLSKKLQSPYVLLVLAKKEHQVDIKASKDMLNKFDKDDVLSPYPWKGTIIPLLTQKKGKDKYSAAILNGYGDIADQISDSYNVKLNSGIGSANKYVINIIKLIFYGTIIVLFIVYFYRRIKKRGKS